MPGKAKSETKKAQLRSEFMAHWRGLAADDYREQLHRKASGLEFIGAGAVRLKWMEACKKETGKDIQLNKQTIINHAKGRPTRAQSNGQKALLTLEETEIVIAYIIELGHRGFPLSHRRLKEHVDMILCTRIGSQFPGVGKNWTGRFIEKWSHRIRMAWSTPLEEKRGRAVNEHTHDAWFDLLGKCIADVDGDMVYGTDEFGTNGVEGQRERVMGSRKSKMVYQQVGGNRENITVIVTICADGTGVPPAVIFKGKAYQVKWKQENPVNASIGYSAKGWTNGEIGIEWIKHFDNYTKVKAAGRKRLLLVDGHNSHYTRAFLRYARENHIEVLCYPAHTTHVYQGLDVAVFAALKRALREERDKYERTTGEKFAKNNFLAIYGKAHLRIMTAETITSAFRRTGVVPFDKSVITAETLAPAKETSAQSALPIVPATPMRLVANMLRDAIRLEVKDDLDDESSESDVSVGGDEEDRNPFMEQNNSPESSALEDDSGSHPPMTPRQLTTPTPTSAPPVLSVIAPPLDQINEAVKRLANSSLACLVRTFHIPDADGASRQQIPLDARPILERLSVKPETERERLFGQAIQDVEYENSILRRRMIELQAANILNEAYCTVLREQLAFKEEKKKKQNDVNGRLMGDGLPVLLTGDFFYERVVQWEAEQHRKESEKADRRVAKDTRDEQLEEWKKQCINRLKEVDQINERWEAAKKSWEDRRRKWEVDKAAGKNVPARFIGAKPKRGPLPKAIPKPKLRQKSTDVSDNEMDADEEDSASNDEDSDDAGGTE